MSHRKDGRAKRASRPRGYWPQVILPHAADIVNSYSTGVTLRQLYYRLVADGTIGNELADYQRLASLTAEGRLAGTFPDLIDTRHTINRPTAFGDPGEAMDVLVNVYRRDRTENQPYGLYIGVEKSGMIAQLTDWFGDRGIPVIALGGWGSTPYVQQVRQDIEAQDRPAVLIYAGDFDPSGAYIGDDFAKRVGLFDEVIRVGVGVHQLVGLQFNPVPDKVEDDSRVDRFRLEFGPSLIALGYPDLVQFELDAFDPDDLHDLYEDAVADYWDDGAHQASLVQEQADLADLKALQP